MHWNWYFFTDVAKLIGFYGKKASKYELILTMILTFICTKATYVIWLKGEGKTGNV